MAEVEIDICDAANSLLEGKNRIKLLEAGCGSSNFFKFKADVHAVGIDISQEQLERNKVVQEKILGDLQTYPLPKGEFDVVACWTVLEHLSEPNDALLNMFASVKPGGLVILGFPNLLSFKGIVTKFTPYWFHKLFYYFIKTLHPPFPTYFRVAIVPNKVTRLAEENGFSVPFFRLVEGTMTKEVRRRFWPVRLGFSAVDGVVRVISGGKSQSLLLDFCGMILQKRA